MGRIGRGRTRRAGADDSLADVSLFPAPRALSVAALGALRPDARVGMKALDDPGDHGLCGLDLGGLDATELAHARSLRSDDERAQFIARRVRLRVDLATRTGVHPRNVSYWREPCARCGEAHGRPRATGWTGYFSSSSTQGLGAVAFAVAPVGVDVERLVSRGTALDVMPLLHPRERDAVEHAFAAGEVDGRRMFTRIWVRKEALLKATGEGLTAPLDRDDLSGPRGRHMRGWHVIDLNMNAACSMNTDFMTNTETDAVETSNDKVFGAYAVARPQPQPSSWRRASSRPK